MDRYTQCFNATRDHTRLRLLVILTHAGTPLSLPELVDIVRRPQYAVSRAMAVLLHAGLVGEARRDGLRYYRIDEDATAADPFLAPLFTAVQAIPTTEVLDTDDLDRLRWRLEVRQGDRCVVTYPEGYNPAHFTGGTPDKERVMVVCVHNSARSQIAEEYLRREGGDLFEVESAGLLPGALNPNAVRVLAEDGLDISAKKPQSVHEVYRRGQTYRYVITVCSPEAERDCPAFPGPVDRLNWPFPDPSAFTGSHQEILARTREVRNAIRDQVGQFVAACRQQHNHKRGIA